MKEQFYKTCIFGPLSRLFSPKSLLNSANVSATNLILFVYSFWINFATFVNDQIV